MSRRLLLICACVLTGVAPGLSASPDAAEAPTEFARIARDAQGRPLALQVAIVTYAPATGPADLRVDLVSAIHVADRAYYQELNERFRDYDELLFEMVVPDEGNPSRDPERSGMSLMGMMQNGMKDVLGLSYQLDEIDYAAPNFVHADLSSGMLAESMAARGESLYVYFWRLVFASLDEYAKDPLGMKDWRLLSGMLTSGQDNALKIAVAEELLASMSSGDILGGEGGSAIIAARNEHAVGVLKQRLDAGTRRVGIFYGVAHMADFEQRLLDELALVKTGTRWVDAWSFRAAMAE